MSTSPQAQQMRTRAQDLRSTANRIEAGSAATVYRFAGPDTWIGPAAQACLDFLVALRRELDTAVQTLRDAARRLDQRADELDAQRVLVVSLS